MTWNRQAKYKAKHTCCCYHRDFFPNGGMNYKTLAIFFIITSFHQCISCCYGQNATYNNKPKMRITIQDRKCHSKYKRKYNNNRSYNHEPTRSLKIFRNHTCQLSSHIPIITSVSNESYEKSYSKQSRSFIRLYHVKIRYTTKEYYDACKHNKSRYRLIQTFA